MLEQSPKYFRLVVRPVAFDHPFATNFAHARQGGVIGVWAVRDGDDVLINVTDNGQGMSPEQMEAVWERDRNRSGIGVRNVDERLKLSFGPDYGLKLTSTHGGGTTVLLRIPFQRSDEPDLLETCNPM